MTQWVQYYMDDSGTHTVEVTDREREVLMALQRGAVVYRPARRPPDELRGSGRARGRVRILEGSKEIRIQDQILDQLVARGLIEVTARRAPGGFRLDYLIPLGIELVRARATS